MNKKKILILGGEYSTIEVVKYAKELGFHTIVTSNNKSGAAKEIADETLMYSTDDIDGISQYIKDNRIDGVFTGASEFHLVNAIKICEKCGLPFYANLEQWETCQNKYNFKKLCQKYGVPNVPEYQLEDKASIVYPVIVKPVDGCSARGITVCNNYEEIIVATNHAKEYSKSQKIIIEKYIENGGTTVSARYIIVDGELYLEAVGDRYVLDPNKGKALITAAAFYPSKHIDYYIKHIDDKVKTMFKGIGLKNGALFMEAIYTEELGIVFYEMGLRVSGGMTYKITEITNDVNELKMLIRHAVTGVMCDKSEIAKIDPYLNQKYTASITLPLREGTIAKIYGLDYIQQLPEVHFIKQYYYENDTILPKHIGTLDQLFARISLICEDKPSLLKAMQAIAEKIVVADSMGNNMIITSKINEIINDYMC